MYVNVKNAHNKTAYQKTLTEIVRAGVCPFCPENFTWHKNPVLKTEGDWFITKSSWPYPNTKFHLLLICLKHKENFADLAIKDFGNIQKLVNWATKTYEIVGGGLTLRFGVTRYTGASVAHLHFHLIVPKLAKTGKARSVWFPIG